MITFRMPLGALPFVIYANDINNNYPFVHFRRKPKEYVLFFIVEGEMHLREDDVTYHLKRGEYLLLDPSRTHEGIKKAPVHYYYIHFTWEGMDEVSMSEEEFCDITKKNRMVASGVVGYKNPAEKYLYLPKYFSLPESTYESLWNGCEKMKEAYHDMLEYYHCRTAVSLLEFFSTISRRIGDTLLHTNGQMGNERIIVLLQYLKTHYQEKITGQDIEKAMHANFDHLNRVFKKYTKQTIFQYLNTYRVETSKKMLRADCYTLHQIAEENGFANEFYYSRVFKKITGYSPTAYKQNIMEQN